MFDPYFSMKENATGIGLSLAYAIIRRHKGHITISSEEGEGTTVVFYLPAAQDVDVDDTEQNTVSMKKKAKVLFMSPCSPDRINIIFWAWLATLSAVLKLRKRLQLRRDR